MRRHAPQRDLVAADERAERADRPGDARYRLVLVHVGMPMGRRAPRREPGLEVHVPDFETPFGAMGLGVDAADEMAVMKDGERVVAVHALVAGGVDLDAVVEAEETRDTVAIPEKGVERREQGRPARAPASGRVTPRPR